VFETLADPTRRRLVEALRSGPKPVGELVKLVDIRQSGVSRHLKILNHAGFVSVRADGQKRIYALNADPFRELDAWVAGYRALWESRLSFLGAELERRQRARAKEHQRGKTE
jgi:DNA-binding transcriptional ArsR family regulator